MQANTDTHKISSIFRRSSSISDRSRITTARWSAIYQGSAVYKYRSHTAARYSVKIRSFT